MANRKRWKPILSGLTTALLGAVWILFAPQKAGGQAAYIIINGNSMEPTFHTNDLVIARTASSYAVRDVVAYTNPQLGTIFHRIVDQQEGQFILQGDNNDWLDSHTPVPEEVIGKLWLHIPKIGGIASQIRQPGIFSLAIFGFLGFAFMTVSGPSSGKTSPKRQKKQPARVTPSEQSQDTLFLLAALGFGALILGVMAFNRPPKISVQESIVLFHEGSFEYFATASPTVYDETDVQTGDPIFPNISDSVTVSFEYNLEDLQVTEINGTHQFVVILKDDSGWKHTAILAPETTFTEPSFTISGSILLKDVQNWVNTFERITGVKRGRYTLTFQPIIEISGIKRGVEFESSFSPALSFSFEEKQVIPLSISDEKITNPTKQFSQTFFNETPNYLSLFGLNFQVSTARIIAAVGFGLALGLGGLQYLRGILVAQQGEVAVIEYSYKHLLIDVEDAETGKERVMLSHFNDLVKIAERHITLIQHAVRGHKHIYFIKLPEATYIYQTDKK